MEFNFRKLKVYYSSLDLVEYVYEIVGNFPKEEKYALGDQLRRAVVSIPSNVVEGVGRASEVVCKVSQLLTLNSKQYKLWL